MATKLIGAVGDGKGLVINVYGQDTSAGSSLTFKVVEGFGDLRGFFQTTKSLQATGYSWGTDPKVLPLDTDLASDVNMSGVKTTFATGYEIGTAGIGKDDISQATFYYGKSLDTVVSTLQNFGMRVMSVGPDRADSAKLVGTFGTPGVSIAKTVTGVIDGTPDRQADSAGDVINYSVAVKNTGSITLAGVRVTDDNLTPGNTGDDVSLSNPAGDANSNGVLDVGETWTYTFSHKVTQAEMDAGTILTNVATVTTDETDPQKSSATTPIVQTPKLAITKTAVVEDGTADKAGDVIDYTIAIKNTGNVTLSSVNVTDSMPGVTLGSPTEDTNTNQKLDVGETWTYTFKKTLTQDDIDAGGTVTNTAKVTTNKTSEQSASVDTPIVQKPSLLIDKYVDSIVGGVNGKVDSAGDIINYKIDVTNNGNVSLGNVKVVDDNLTASDLTDDVVGSAAGGALLRLTSGDANSNNVLDVGETWTYTFAHKVTTGEFNAGLSLTNSAWVTTDRTSKQSDSTTTEVVHQDNFANNGHALSYATIYFNTTVGDTSGKLVPQYNNPNNPNQVTSYKNTPDGVFTLKVDFSSWQDPHSNSNANSGDLDDYYSYMMKYLVDNKYVTSTTDVLGVAIHAGNGTAEDFYAIDNNPSDIDPLPAGGLVTANLVDVSLSATNVFAGF